MVTRAHVVVRGIVQGVGFRPFVYALAEKMKLSGHVTNTPDGVFIEVEGDDIPGFLARLRSEAPPLSRITDLSAIDLPAHGLQGFSIRGSINSSSDLPFTLVSPDMSVCDDCMREMLDPADRRFLYPFINCTNCGPRYSITMSVPYDRLNTTMARFTMCPACRNEYDDPSDRRFHAQPNACPVCGPKVEFKVQSSEFRVKDSLNHLEQAISMLKQGGVVAIKGLGGFHLACDAANDAAVRRLRERKRKSNKPFAVMAADIHSFRKLCDIGPGEERALLSARRPIVLVRKKRDAVLPEAVSPRNSSVGCMLPYTPLHYLLFRQPLRDAAPAAGPHFSALVMTSGNIAEEPIVRNNEEAVENLAGLADGFLLHDRDIFMRVDDSVLRVQSKEFVVRSKDVNAEPHNHSELQTPNAVFSFIRRSRGYAPDPIILHSDGPEVLGCGADLKNTFTLTKGGFAITSQHIGDMENFKTVQFFEECLDNLKSVYRTNPRVVVHDLHPGYLSTQWAHDFGMRNAERGVKTYGVQHHYAHIGAVMAEHGLAGPVIGVALDGTGYGTDGNLWGGEFLIADCDGFERAGQFRYVPLPGGESAIREPWRTAVGYIFAGFGEYASRILEDTGFIRKYGSRAIEQLLIVASKREFSPLASGAGRLFDAVAAITGVCDRNTFEGEAAMALESVIADGIDDEYVIEMKREKSYTVVDFSATINGIIRDRSQAIPVPVIAARFHNTVARAVRSVVRVIRERTGIAEVALGGGTFQNRYLLQRTSSMLARDGLRVFMNEQVPCSDAGVSLGQAYLIRERLKKCGIRNADYGV